MRGKEAVAEPAARLPRWVLATVVALVILPLGVAAVAEAVAVGTDYYPAGDLADIELHTRDVGRHPVELGQYSREDWSHPGPALFYALALPYRLSGSSSIGNNIGALLINGLSLVGILLVAHRRGGPPLLWTTAVGCALLLRGFGPLFLLEPWNPSVPVLPFGLFLFLVWDITCRGTWAIPLAAAVGTFCVQTHVGYLPLVLPLFLLAAAVAVWSRIRADDARSGAPAHPIRADDARSGAPAHRSGWVALGATVAVLGVMWLPPVLQERQPGEGNLSRTYDYFRAGEGEQHSLTDGYGAVAAQFAATPEWVTGSLDLTPFTTEPDFSGGLPWPVLALPVLVGGLVSWRRRSAPALRLLAVTTLAAGLSVLAVSRTLGPIFHYRLGFTRVVAMTAVLTAAWALWVAVVDRWAHLERRVLVPLSVVVLVGLAAVGVPRFARSGPPNAGFSDRIERHAPEMAPRLPSGDGPVIFRCDGDQGCIFMAGLVLWFDRHGIEAQVDNAEGVVSSGAPHRVYGGGPVRAVLHVRIDQQFYVRAMSPDNEVVAYAGDAPSARRARLATELLALDARYQAGELELRLYYIQRVRLTDQLGHVVGVLLEPFAL